MTFFLFSPYSPEGYMARITFRLLLLNAFNNPMYCKAVVIEMHLMYLYIQMAI